MAERSYHHGNLRAALLEAAVAGVRERGAEALALRELARTVGVSHNAAYRHFGDRDELVAAVAQVGMAELGRHLARGVDALETGASSESGGDAGAGGDPDAVRRARARLWAVGRAYVGFALAEPGLFRVAFAAFSGMPPPEERLGGGPDAPDPFTQLVDCLDALVDVGWLAPEARPDAELACWASVHGFASLCLDGPLRELPAVDRELALDRMLELIDRSLGASADLPYPGPPR